jgi:hypothetical protein
VHEEKDERDLWTITVMKPAWGTAIRFLGSLYVQPLGAVRLWFTLPRGCSRSSTSTVYFIYFALIIQALTIPKCEPMISFWAMGWIHLVFVVVLLNFHEIPLLRSDTIATGRKSLWPWATGPSLLKCCYSGSSVATGRRRLSLLLLLIVTDVQTSFARRYSSLQ